MAIRDVANRTCTLGIGRTEEESIQIPEATRSQLLVGAELIHHDNKNHTVLSMLLNSIGVVRYKVAEIRS